MSLSTLEKDYIYPRQVKVGEPVWPLAFMFPLQGEWTEEDFFALETDRRMELSNGCLEILPLPTPLHQLIAQFLYRVLEDFVLARKLGLVFIAGAKVRLWPEKVREPDLLFVRPGRILDRDGPVNGADIAMEVVSEGREDRMRDLVTKRSEYARAGISEYWIVDPQKKQITLLVLQGKKYRVQGVFAPGSRVASVELPGFEVDVTAVFAVEELLPPAKKSPKRKPRSSRRSHQ